MVKWLIIAASLLLPITAQAQKVTKLSPVDYEEIRVLYAQYSYGFDTGNPQIYAGTYTPDGEFASSGQVKCKGRDQLLAFVHPFASGKPNLKHVPANIFIEPSPEGAKGIAYVILVTYEAGKPPTVTGGGTYQDTIVKTPNGWRFKRRNFSAFGTEAPPSTP